MSEERVEYRGEPIAVELSRGDWASIVVALQMLGEYHERVKAANGGQRYQDLANRILQTMSRGGDRQ